MRSNNIVATLCIGLVMLVAVVMSTRSEGSSQAETDYRDIAAQLVQRGAVSDEGSFTYRQYKFITQASDFDELAATLLDSQTSSIADVRSAAEQWLADHMPAEREAWIGGCAYLGATWRSHRHRMPGIDTALFTATAHAQAADMRVAPIVHDVVTHVDGEILTVVEDSRAVFRRARTGHRHPAVPVDISMASWQEAIDLGANIEGQEIFGSVEGARHSILYVNTAQDGTWVAAEYEFRDDLDWAPSELRSFDEAGTDARIVYGYDLADAAPVTRPAVVAQGLLTETGEIDVVVWVIDTWVADCDASEVMLRLPPVHLEVDYLLAPDVPLVEMREPEYLQGVESCHKAVVAAVNVAVTIGSEQQETDFDCDGYVTLSDIDTAVQTFSGAEQEP